MPHFEQVLVVGVAHGPKSDVASAVATSMATSVNPGPHFGSSVLKRNRNTVGMALTLGLVWGIGLKVGIRHV